MKSHVYRPLYVVIAFVAIILIVRAVAIRDKDFAAHETGYRFGWHDKQNEEYWRDGFKVKYMDRNLCFGCHQDKASVLLGSAHRNINCQNCHAAEGVVGADHPEKIDKMAIDRSRAQCLRCHAQIPDVGSGRANIARQVDGLTHPWDEEKETQCVTCHDVHAAAFK